jgi:hypothetical protein
VSRCSFLAGVLWCASCGRIGFDEVDGPVAIAARSVELTTTCGELAPAGTDLTVENRGTSELRIESAAASDGFTVPTQFPLVIAPGGQVAITVTPPRTVIGSDLGGAIKRGTLALVTDSVLPVPAIELAATVVGANITVTGENDETVLAFVSAGNACPIGQRVVLHNTGNATATVDGVSATSIGLVAPPASAAIEPGTDLLHDVFLRTAMCQGNDQITYVLGGAVCTVTPVAIDVTFDITGVPNCRCQTPVSPA